MTQLLKSTRTLHADVPAATIAATQETIVGRAPYAGVVTEVRITPVATAVAAVTHFRTFTLINKGQAGAGTAVVAVLAQDTATTDNITAFVKRTMPLGAAADLVVAEGDVLALVETVSGNGLAHAELLLGVDIQRS